MERQECLWPLNAALLLAGGCLPSVLLVWFNGAQWVDGGASSQLLLWAAVDILFVLTVTFYLRIGEQYGKQRCPSGVLPYPGAWIGSDGVQHPPGGFLPFYLPLAGVISFISPALALAAAYWIYGRHTGAAMSLIVLPYFLVFVPQTAMETKFFKRSIMAPIIPVVFVMYRLWQFTRGYFLATRVAPLPTSLQYYIVFLVSFWLFDTAALLTWMPWTYNWELSSRLTRSDTSGSSSKQKGNT